MAELTVDDFSGGITDNYVGAPVRKAEVLDNFNLEYHSGKVKLLTRSGSEVYDTSVTGERAIADRVGAIKVFDGKILNFINRSVYQYVATVGWVKLIGPTSNQLYPSTTTTSNVCSMSEWNRHLLITNDDLSSVPSKLYNGKIVSGAATAAGTTVTLADHSLVNGQLVTYTSSTPFTGLTSGNNYYVLNASSTEFKLSLTQGGLTIGLTNNPGTHTFTPVTLMIRTAGLPQLASDPTCVLVAGGTAVSYLYRFIYEYTYTNDTVTFVDLGPTRQLTLAGNGVAPAAAGNRMTIAAGATPVLSNGSNLNYDIQNIKVSVYRTTSNGTVFYLVGTIAIDPALGTFLAFNDAVTDTTLVGNSLLYTEGGVLDNDAPLPAKIVHVTNTDVAYYVHVKDGTEVLKSTILQAKAADIDSLPADNAIEIDEEIVGFSSKNALGIALCLNSAYRIEGTYDELGRGAPQRFKISDTCSCVSSQSVVQTLDGVFWAGKDAFYYTNGYQVIKINEEWATTYSTLVDTDAKKLKIQGKYDSFNRRIVWTVQKEDTENDTCYVLHLRSGINENSSFTTWSSEDNFYPTAIEFSGNNMYHGDKRGYFLIHSPDHATDAKIDTLVYSTSWNTKYIPYQYKGSAMDFGVLLQRKYATSFILTCKNKSNISVQVKSNNDDNKQIRDLKPIRFRGNVSWGDPDIEWGDPDIVWAFDGIIENVRAFPQTSLRFSYKQIEITNAYVAIYNSDSLGLGNVDSSAKTVDLVDAATLDWPTDLVDYYISFESDGYVVDYLITSRASADQIVYEDLLNSSATAATSKWVIRGYPKGEIVNILAYTIGYIVFGSTQDSFAKNTTGEVGASSADT